MAKGHTRWRGQSIEVLAYRGHGKYTTKTVRWQGTKKATQTEADRVLRDLLDELDAGGNGTDATVAQLVKRWRRQSEPDWSPATIAAYDSYLRLHILPALGDSKVRDIRPADLDDFYAALRANGLSPASIGKVHVILRRAFAEAVRWRWCGHNPAADARPPKITKKELRPPTAEEVRKLIDLAATRDRALYTYVILAADSGARRGELVALRWRNVDLEAGELVIDRALTRPATGPAIEKDTKTHQARRIALGSPCVAALKEHRRQALESALAVGVKLGSDAYVFTLSVDGKTPWRPDGATSRFMRLRNAAQLPTVRLHDLRHALITDWLAAGVDQRTVMGRVGHASLQTLTRYAHFVAAADKAAAERLGDRHSKSS